MMKSKFAKLFFLIITVGLMSFATNFSPIKKKDMLRIYKYDNPYEFDDFEGFLFTTTKPRFDHQNDKVSINGVDYRISTINYIGLFNQMVENMPEYTISLGEKDITYSVLSNNTNFQLNVNPKLSGCLINLKVRKTTANDIIITLPNNSFGKDLENNQITLSGAVNETFILTGIYEGGEYDWLVRSREMGFGAEVLWSEIVGLPALFPPEAHSHPLINHTHDAIVFDENNKVSAINGKVEVKSPYLDINSVTFIKNDLIVEGDIYQQGKTYKTHAEELYSANDMIIMRDGAVAGLATNELSGFRILNYDGVNNLALAVGGDGVGRIGDESGDLQAIATREDTPTNQGFAFWDNASLKFKTKLLGVSDISDFQSSVTNNAAVLANSAKVGITPEQASAIIANSAKVGITPEQANAIEVNSAKVGITTAQANAISANSAKISSQWANINGGINYSQGGIGIGVSLLGATEALSIYSELTDRLITVQSGTGKSIIGQTNGFGGYILLQDKDGNNNVRIRSYGDSYFNGGFIGFGTADPKAGIDYIGTNGMALFSDTPTANSTKTNRLGTYHYNTDIDPFIGLLQISNNTDNQLRLGGGTGLGNAATFISFYTAPNNTTTTGSECARFNGSGYFGIGTGSSIPEKLSILEGNLDLNKGDGVDFPKINLKSSAITTTIGTITRDVTNALLFEANTTTRDFTFRNTSGDLVTIKGSGKIGVNITTPATSLHIYQNDTLTDNTAGLLIEQNGTGDAVLQFLLTGSRRWVLGVDNSDSDKFKISSTVGLGSGDLLTMDINGATTFASTVTATNFIASSDKRLKQNIRPIKLKGIDSIELKQFNLKPDKRKRYGVIAQELEEIAPEMVYTNEKGFKQVAYIDFLIAKVASLESRIKQLEG